MGEPPPQPNQPATSSGQAESRRDRFKRKLDWLKRNYWKIVSAVGVASAAVGVALLVALIANIVVQGWIELQANPTEDSKRKFDGSLSIATTTATFATGFVLFLNFCVSYQKLQQEIDKAKVDASFAEKRLTAERFSKAVEMLGDEKSIHVRLGGIYSLESIANGSNPDKPDENYRQVFEVLTAFVRETRPYPPREKNQEGLTEPVQSVEKTEEAVAVESQSEPIPPLPIDIAAILTVVKRRKHKDTDWEHFSLDLRESDLRGADLRNAALRKADFGAANLQEVSFGAANLQGAFLDRANLQNASLNKANLQKANLERADLKKASLETANLQEANLWEADLQEAILTEADLQKADLRNAKLQKARLPGADLREADIRANLTGAFLTEAKLQKAKIRGVNLVGVDFTGAELQEADLRNAKLGGVELWNANLKKAKLEGANLQRANLYRANLQEAFLTDANLRRASLIGANLWRAKLWGANLQGAWLWSSDVKESDLPQLKEKVKAMLTSAEDWQEAKYDPEIRELLGLPPEPSTPDQPDPSAD